MQSHLCSSLYNEIMDTYVLECDDILARRGGMDACLFLTLCSEQSFSFRLHGSDRFLHEYTIHCVTPLSTLIWPFMEPCSCK